MSDNNININTPEIGPYTHLQPFRFWCQKVLPLVYDESLSYYELLCKVVDYLNKTMEDVDQMITDMGEFQTAYTDFTTETRDAYIAFSREVSQAVEGLETFVNNYFNNLNVQQEINNKLDAMAEAGYFSNLFDNLFTADVITEAGNVTSAWIAANLLQETGYVLDKSLTVENAAADAKAAGDAINEVKSMVEEISETKENLLPYGKFELTIGGVDITYENGVLTRSGTSSASEWGYIPKSIILPAGDYFFYVESQLSNAYELRSGDGLTTFANANDNRSFTLLSDTEIVLYIQIQVIGATFNDNKYLQINTGSDAKTWEAVTLTAVDDEARAAIVSIADDIDNIESDISDINSDINELNGVIYGDQIVLTATEVSEMYNSSGVLVQSTETYKFYEVDNVLGLENIKLNYQHDSGGYTTHWVNQFDNSGTLLSYTPYYDASASYDLQILPACKKIIVLVYNSNGSFTPSYQGKGVIISGFTKMSALGDSITYGYTADGNITETYLKQIADKLNCNYQKLGVISTPICPNSNYTGTENDNAFVYRWNQIANDADLIVVAGGTNDYRHDVPLGTASDSSSLYETTFYGALNYLITNICTNYPHARLVFITPFHRQGDYQANGEGHTLKDYVDAIKTKCENYGIKCVDGYAASGINTIPAVQTINMNDGLHPTQSGHNLIYKNLMPEFAML